MRGQKAVLFTGIVCVFLGLGQAAVLVTSGRFQHYSTQVVIGWGIGMSLGLACMSFHIASFPCSQLIPVSTIMLKYALFWYYKVTWRRRWRTFEKLTHRCTEEQTAVLLQRIRANENTIYGRARQFKFIRSVEDFMRRHPLTTYKDYSGYIKRVANGEIGVMTHNKPSILGKTSGTTGISKQFPISDECLEELTTSATVITNVLRSRHGVANSLTLQMNASLLTASRTSISKGGIPTGPLTTFVIGDDVKELMFTTPLVGFDIGHEPTAMYVHALFALRDEQLGSIWAPFASTIYIFVRFLEISWNMLVNDIRHGTLSGNLEGLSAKEREELSGRLVKMPDRANEVERQFRMGFENIVPRLWPRLIALYGITSGSMQTFTRRLKYYIGDRKIFSGYYVSTEGLIGFACEFPDDGQTKYMCIPDGPFYEFIPADYCDEKCPGTLLMGEVREGECYELVITNKDGLYRYRLGDVVKITGFFNQSPVFQFQYRIGELMNLRSEKTSEVAVTRALQETVDNVEGVQLVEYVCADGALVDEAMNEKTPSHSMYYVIFVELAVSKGSEFGTRADQCKQFTAEFDANLRSAASAYDSCRESNELGPPRVFFVDSQAFSDFRVHLLESSSGGWAQLKVPRKLRLLEWVQLFLEHELKHDPAEMDRK
ncbi:uncharacterized protein [Diadema antillarum]|uniref:uncharacterized protein n=1 Tax=Diadema antillarum TaxID=105358 RepID=UPI003A89CEB3